MYYLHIRNAQTNNLVWICTFGISGFFFKSVYLLCLPTYLFYPFSYIHLNVRRDREFSLSVSFPDVLQELGLDQAEGKSMKLNLGLSHAWQERSWFSQCRCPEQGHWRESGIRSWLALNPDSLTSQLLGQRSTPFCYSPLTVNKMFFIKKNSFNISL